jgi:hypothetical protein
MAMIGIALIVFSSVLLIVSIYYIKTNTRHKERMAMIEKGMKPEQSQESYLLLDTLKFAFGIVGAGIGFLIGTVLESARLFDASIELPLYFAPILITSGLSLGLFYRLYKNHLKK